MAYADITTGDPSSIKSWIQRRRLQDAASVLKGQVDGRVDVLDFGAGNAELACRIAGTYAHVHVVAYEPAPALFAEAQERSAGSDRVSVTNTLEGIRQSSYDYVFCLEVFEHLPTAQASEVLLQMRKLLKPTGLAIVGVPYEIFLPALVKGVL